MQPKHQIPNYHPYNGTYKYILCIKSSIITHSVVLRVPKAPTFVNVSPPFRCKQGMNTGTFTVKYFATSPNYLTQDTRRIGRFMIISKTSVHCVGVLRLIPEPMPMSSRPFPRSSCMPILINMQEPLV